MADDGLLRLPSLGADMESAVLVEWKIAPGSRISNGDVIALIETDKGLLDLEAFEAGTIAELLAQPGCRVPVGTPIARFEGAAQATSAQAPAAHAPAAQDPAAQATAAQAPSAQPASPVRASPAARERARALGVELASLSGSGPGGAVVLEDVERAARRPATMREAIGAAMSHAAREIPHYYAALDVDFSPGRAWLETHNAGRPPAERILPAALLLRAVARAALEQPGFNGSYGARGFEPATALHLGVAIALRGGGLVAPAIHDAGTLALPALMAQLRSLVDRARRGHLRSSEFTAATLTVTALGDDGADLIFPIIHAPQVAMVGFGTPRLRPWVVDGQLAPREVISCTLAADHRVTDGRDGARFLAAIARRLARPGED